MPHGRYGVDAPGLVGGFLAAACVLGCAGLAVVRLAGSWPWTPWVSCLLFLIAVYALFMVTYMLWGSLVAKVRGRDAILDLIPWRGDERVLDVGCGRGLLLIGAAHRLTTGTATGVDLWIGKDQSSNRQEITLRNAMIEGVADRMCVETADMRQLPFPNESFDLVVSSWAVHNLELKEDREQALAGMVRVLKPGGWILLNDIVHREEYKQEFERLGLVDVRLVLASQWKDAFAGAVSFGSFRPATVMGQKG